MHSPCVRQVKRPGVPSITLTRESPLAKSVQREQLARGNGNGAGLVRKPQQFSLEVGEALDLGLGDQTVNGIVEFGGDGDRIRAGERGADQKRRGHVRRVAGVVVQRVDHLVRAAGERNDHLEIQTLAAKETFAIPHGNRQRKNTPHRRVGLTVTQRNPLRRRAGRVKNGSARTELEEKKENCAQFRSSHRLDYFAPTRCMVHSVSIAVTGFLAGGGHRKVRVCL